MAESLGLTPEPISTQVIPRDRHAALFTAMAITASAIERLATEIRHLQRTEVREAQEYFGPGQKGSSAMPHKRNPILTENLTGLARIVRMAVTPALENITVWHERDISHSSVERMIGPDATVTLDFALNRMATVIEKLVVYPNNMLEHVNKFGGIHDSQRILLALTQLGLSREEAYTIVQNNAMKVWRSFGIDPENPDTDFEPTEEDQMAASHDNRLMFFLSKDKKLRAELSEEDLSLIFQIDSLKYHTKHVNTIFQRVFGIT